MNLYLNNPKYNKNMHVFMEIAEAVDNPEQLLTKKDFDMCVKRENLKRKQESRKPMGDLDKIELKERLIEERMDSWKNSLKEISTCLQNEILYLTEHKKQSAEEMISLLEQIYDYVDYDPSNFFVAQRKSVRNDYVREETCRKFIESCHTAFDYFQENILI